MQMFYMFKNILKIGINMETPLIVETNKCR